MSAVKADFSLPKALSEKLKRAIPRGDRSAFVAQAIHDSLEALLRARIKAVLREGYAATRDENAQVDQEWERATLEDWPK